MAEPITALSPGQRRRLLEKEVGPGSPLHLNYLGLEVQQKTDPVLRYLARSDEREYDKMLKTDTAISGAVEQRITGLCAHGSEVVEGPSRSAGAKLLRDFAITLLKGIDHFPTVWREVMRAVFYGWRPVQLEWTMDMRFGGRSYWGVTAAIVHDPWHWQVAEDGSLIFVGQFDKIQVFDMTDPAEQLRWMICTAGSTRTPYGEAWLQRLWMLYFLSRQFEKMSSEAMQRSLGILKVAISGGVGLAVNQPVGADDAKLEAEILAMTRRLTASNVLLQKSGVAVDFLKDIQFTDSYGKVIDLLDNRKRLAIVGQNLTSQVQEGSFAAAKTHADVLEDFIRADGRESSGWINDQLIAPAIELNFGEVEQDDMPKWRPKIFSRIDMAMLQAYVDLGGGISARELADAGNIPAVIGEAREGDEVLKKSAPVNIFGLPPAGNGGGEEEDEGDDRTRREDNRPPQATARTAAVTPIDGSGRQRAIDRDIDRIGVTGAAGEFASYYEAFSAALRQANDPKA